MIRTNSSILLNNKEYKLNLKQTSKFVRDTYSLGGRCLSKPAAPRPGDRHGDSGPRLAVLRLARRGEEKTCAGHGPNLSAARREPPPGQARPGRALGHGPTQ